MYTTLHYTRAPSGRVALPTPSPPTAWIPFVHLYPQQSRRRTNAWPFQHSPLQAREKSVRLSAPRGHCWRRRLGDIEECTTVLCVLG